MADEDWPTCPCGWELDLVPIDDHDYRCFGIVRLTPGPCLACMIRPQIVCEECGTVEPANHVEGGRCPACGVPLCSNCTGWSHASGHGGHCPPCSLEFCVECQRIKETKANV